MQCPLALVLSIAPHGIECALSSPYQNCMREGGRGQWGIPLIKLMYYADITLYLCYGSNLLHKFFSLWRLKHVRATSTVHLVFINLPISLSPNSGLLSFPMNICQNMAWNIVSIQAKEHLVPYTTFSTHAQILSLQDMIVKLHSWSNGNSLKSGSISLHWHKTFISHTFRSLRTFFRYTVFNKNKKV